MHVTLDGLSLCEVDDDGVRWSAQRDQMTGWGSPSPRGEAAPRARAHGVWVGDEWLDGRHLTLGGNVYASDEDALSIGMDRLAAAAALSPVDLVVTEGDRVRRVSVVREDQVSFRLVTPGNGRPRSAIGQWSIQLLAPDPRKYGSPLSASTGLPVSSGGLVVPLVVPVVIDETQTAGRVRLVNPGNVTSPVRLRIDGPTSGVLRGPVVTHVQSGRRLALPAALLGPSEFLTLADRQVLAQGTEPRAGWLSERGWFDLAPGVNDIAWEAAASGPGALLTVESWEAWA